MDEHLRNVQNFHRIFGVPMRQEPGFPDLTEEDKGDIRLTAQNLAEFARILKVQAAAYGAAGREAVREVFTRIQLHVEETAELFAAVAEGDIVGVLDALTDIDYVNNGTYLTFGMGALKTDAHRMVHSSNLSKLDGDGKPIVGVDGRVVKGPHYQPPTVALHALIYGSPSSVTT